MWNIAKLAKGMKMPRIMLLPSCFSVGRMREGRSSLEFSMSSNSGDATIRRRANSATTLMAKATKNG